MGGKQLSKGNPIFFHLAIGLGVMVLLSGCQTSGFSGFNKKPEYVTDVRHIEQIQSLINKKKFKSALAENEKLISYYDYIESRSGDYDRVIRVSARMNSALLKQIIQDKKKIFVVLKKKEQRELTIKKLTARIDKLTRNIQGLTMILKTKENLEKENQNLRQQIKAFKKIDLEGG